MKLVLATSNKGKVREIKAICQDFEVIPYSDLIQEFEIIEDAHTFKSNALLKAHAVFDAIGDENIIVIADDSGEGGGRGGGSTFITHPAKVHRNEARENTLFTSCFTTTQ